MSNIMESEDDEIRNVSESAKLIRQNQYDQKGPDDAHTYEEAIEAAGYGWYHVKLLALCGWAVCSDSIEVVCVSFVLPSAECDLELSSSDKGWINAIVFAGMMVGGYLWGSLADVRGRRAILLWSLLVNALGGLASSVAQVFWLFLLMRFISGVGVGGSMPVVFAYFTEFQPKSKRGAMISLLAMFWTGGNIFAAALAWIVIPHIDLGYFSPEFTYDSWRIYIALCMIPSLTSAFIFVLMPESPKFLMQIGKEEAALNVLRRVYEGNHRKAATAYKIRRLVMPYRSEDSEVRSRTVTNCCSNTVQLLKKIFAAGANLFKGPLLSVSVVMLAIYFTLSFGYYGLTLWFPELFKRMEQFGGSPCQHVGTASNSTQPPSYLNSSCRTVALNTAIYFEGFLTACVTMPANFFTVLTIDRIGRKVLLASSMVVSGTSVYFIYLVQNKAGSVAMSCLFSSISNIGWNVLDVLGVELYPTNLRSTASGVFQVVGRIAAILGNVSFGELVDVHCAVPMTMVAVLLSVGGLMSIKLPNYTKKDLL